MEQPTAQFIKKDALIPIKIGTDYISRLQKILLFLLDGKTEEEIAIFQEHIENNTVPEETWMYHYQTINVLLVSIENIAIESNMLTSEDT